MTQNTRQRCREEITTETSCSRTSQSQFLVLKDMTTSATMKFSLVALFSVLIAASYVNGDAGDNLPDDPTTRDLSRESKPTSYSYDPAPKPRSYDEEPTYYGGKKAGGGKKGYSKPAPTYRPEPKPTYGPEPKPTARPEPKPTYPPEPKPTYPPEPKPTYPPEPKPTYRPDPKPTYGGKKGGGGKKGYH